MLLVIFDNFSIIFDTLCHSLKKSSVKKSVREKVRFLNDCVGNSRMRIPKAFTGTHLIVIDSLRTFKCRSKISPKSFKPFRK